jgi:hypothetical protein
MYILSKSTNVVLDLFHIQDAIEVEIFLEQTEAAFLSPNKICENLNFSPVQPKKFKFSQILLGDKNATYLCSEIISTVTSMSCLDMLL